MEVGFEHIQNNPNSCFRVLHNNKPISQFTWAYHYHPEIELVCVTGGGGTRHVGYHKSTYKDGDLVLIGSNIPHSGFGLHSLDPHEEVVVQFKKEVIFFPDEEKETKAIERLLSLSKYGICFGSQVKERMIPRFIEMLSLKGLDRYLLLLTLLYELSLTEDYILLNKEVMPFSIIIKNGARLKRIFTYVEENYHREIKIAEIARLTNLTIPAFCNFFKKSTKMTFAEFLNRYRVNKACLYFAQSMSVSECCYHCGFNSLSYFNRVFKKFTEKSPSEFRNEFTIEGSFSNL